MSSGRHQVAQGRGTSQPRVRHKLTPATRKGIGWCSLATGAGGFLLTLYLSIAHPHGPVMTTTTWVAGHVTFAVALLSFFSLRAAYREAPMPRWGRVGFRFGLAELLASVLSAGAWMGIGQFLSGKNESIALGLYLALAGTTLFLFGVQVAEWRGLSGRPRYLYGFGLLPLVWGGLGCGAIATMIAANLLALDFDEVSRLLRDLLSRSSSAPYFVLLKLAPLCLLLGLALCVLPGLRNSRKELEGDQEAQGERHVDRYR